MQTTIPRTDPWVAVLERQWIDAAGSVDAVMDYASFVEFVKSVNKNSGMTSKTGDDVAELIDDPDGREGPQVGDKEITFAEYVKFTTTLELVD